MRSGWEEWLEWLETGQVEKEARVAASATAGELLISYPSTQQATTPTHLLRPAMLWPRSVVLGYAGGFARSRPITQQPAPSVTREETAAEAARPPQAFMSHS
eukprot:COSAG06_NODE_25637_length_632_cov_0.923077_2_plen_101_part_01